MTPYPQLPPPSAGPSSSSTTTSSGSRKKESVKFSTLDHPPRANLLPPAALLSLLSLAFLCLVFVCFRHTEWIVKARRKIWKLVRDQATKISDQIAEYQYNRQGMRRIKLLTDQEEEQQQQDQEQGRGTNSLGRPRNLHQDHSLNLASHHHQSRILGASNHQSSDMNAHLDTEMFDEDEDNEVLPDHHLAIFSR
ncbi:hypothetical protein MJO28_015447 [Puccinia striiformis f. sp. tritici]|uniref:Uncharacterized protein n=1 Tax=Puccinia striiformis f. sp. tritici TaxID=168172 RepID=A0ACC0DSQ4_9BASI|nr:hypothetical protein Pst134EB_028755 [Puccinia striiformis f. sp. tritici]KAI7938527.1 hypothetical protein MJO28_015447 [Puccinia striiformis f. sp. tritici]KAI9627974.1 hypothetical protein KEM48_011912 [Puccinia striiformis f. sp. tritici PST-130]